MHAVLLQIIRHTGKTDAALAVARQRVVEEYRIGELHLLCDFYELREQFVTAETFGGSVKITHTRKAAVFTLAPNTADSSELSHIDHEPVFHIALKHPFIGGVDVVHGISSISETMS